ncbi:universal stress protein [Hugenholtzia roseola]|uniref:universal stress protein n=1 Tax=Hugenholtzia roseola TaxID=1002 RepID=UPI00047BDEF6|nr:universal stress protein [Hugenholtzia roseola]
MKPYLLVVTDFTTSSWLTLSYALVIAKRQRWNIFLAHPFLMDIPPGSNQHLFDERLKSLTLQGEAKMQALLASVRLPEGESLAEWETEIEITSLVKRGQVGDVVKELLRGQDIAMIAIDIEGERSWENFFLNDSIFADTGTPVLAIPEGAPIPKNFDYVVYATRLDDNDESLIRNLIDFATTFEAKLDCLHICTDSKKMLEENSKMSDLRTQLGYSLLDTHINFKIVVEKQVRSGLENFLQKQQEKQQRVDLLVMRKQERNFFARLLNKSLEYGALAQESQVPLLVYRS